MILAISDDLKGNAHVAETVKKLASRLYLLWKLKRARLDPHELVIFYKQMHAFGRSPITPANTSIIAFPYTYQMN